MIGRRLLIGVAAAAMAASGCRTSGDTTDAETAATTATTTATRDTSAVATGAAPTSRSPATSSSSSPPVTTGVPACASPPAVGLSRITVAGGGAQHAVRVFVPSSFAGTALPAVLDWHGLGSNGDEQAALSGYEDLADEQGFIVVHPTGVADPVTGITSWQLADDPAGPDDPAGARDDVAFVEALIDELVARWCVDPTRVYATGMSNGGYFTTRLLCELGDRIAAGVAVAGLHHPDDCAPGRPVPLLAFHGTDDRVVPYEGGDSVLFGAGVPPDLGVLFEQSIRSEYEQFVAGNGCITTATDTFLDSEIVIHTYDGCDGGFVMALFEVRFGGHTWPGSPLREVLDDSLGFTTGRVEATRDGWVYIARVLAPVNAPRWSAGVVCLAVGVLGSACSGERPDLVDAAPSTLVAGAVVAPACSGPTPGLHEVTIDGGGAQYAVRIVVPSSFSSTRLPVVIGFHGLGSTGADQARLSGYEQLAEQEGFVAVHPTAVANSDDTRTIWQLATPVAGTHADAHDDVAFATALIDAVVGDVVRRPCSRRTSPACRTAGSSRPGSSAS